MRHIIELGKIDYNGSGRRNCAVTIKYVLKDGRFSMSGTIWNTSRTGAYSCGQNLEEIASYFRSNKKVQRMVAVWRDWRLNDMTAGSPAQMEWLKAHKSEGEQHPFDHYQWACAALAEAGLNPDPSYLHNGKPYSYGTAWLTRELPPEIIAEIESLSQE